MLSGSIAPGSGLLAAGPAQVLSRGFDRLTGSLTGTFCPNSPERTLPVDSAVAMWILGRGWSCGAISVLGEAGEAMGAVREVAPGDWSAGAEYHPGIFWC